MCTIRKGLLTYRTKNYVAFDGDEDLMSYRTIQSWDRDTNCSFHLNDAHDINYCYDDSLPESICKQLKERLDCSKNFILIIGSNINKNRKGIVQYEINYALRNKLPIILLFKGYNCDTEASSQLWHEKLFPKIPALIRNAKEKYCLVSPFTRNALEYAMNKYSNNNLPLNENGYTWNWR